MALLVGEPGSNWHIPNANHDPADAVHQMLKDELDLDGRPNLNLARYCFPATVDHASKLTV